MKRSLSLKRESLSSLDAEDLSGVVGGRYTGPGGITCDLLGCFDVLETLSEVLTCNTCLTYAPS